MEIKIRVWDGKEMHYDVQNFGEGQFYRAWGLLALGEVLADESMRAMLFTGLKDRNGRKIYEGDVVRLVKHLRFDDCIDMEVQFHNGSFVMVYTGAQGGAGRSKYSEAFHSPMFDPCRRDTMEVIGNIHENPELLKA